DVSSLIGGTVVHHEHLVIILLTLEAGQAHPSVERLVVDRNYDTRFHGRSMKVAASGPRRCRRMGWRTSNSSERLSHGAVAREDAALPRREFVAGHPVDMRGPPE